MSELIKQDINFLEYPLYVLTEKTTKEDINITIGDKEYTLLVGYKTPNSLDVLYLYYFIKMFQKSNYPAKLTIKTSALIKEISSGCSSFYYSRLKESLRIWKNIGLSFKGSFYDGKEYQVIEFGILEVGKIEKDGTIIISFNEIFLSILKNTNFYRYINFNEFKILRKPVSRRLYEILKKVSFPYKIDVVKLAKKMPLKQKFPSQIIQKIIPAIKEINKLTSLNVDFAYKKNEDDNVICTFKLIKAKKEVPFSSSSLDDIDSKNLTDLFNLLPANKKSKRVFELLEAYVKEDFDYNYIKYNVIYSICNAKKNFYIYLLNSLKNDYAKEYREFEELNLEIQEKKKLDEEEKNKKSEEYLKFTLECKDFISKLSSEEYNKYALVAKEEIILEWSSKGLQNITGNSFIPSHLIEEKIYTTCLKNK